MPKQQTDTKMRDLRDHISQLSEATLTQAERSDLTQYHFAEAIRQVRVIRRLSEAFAQEREDELPTQVAEQVRQHVKQTVELVNSMISFQVEQPNAEQAHKQITQRVQSNYTTFVSQLRQHIRGSADSVAAVERLEATRARAEELLDTIDETSRKAEQLVNRGETLNAEIAAGKLSTYYDAQATKHQQTSKWFLIGAAVSAAAVVCLALVFFLTIDERTPAQWTAYIRDLGVRVFVLGIGLYVVGFMVKAYRSNQHVLVVNQHKANALKTFLLFQASASGDSSRDLITAELVKAVFAPDETGFLDNAPDRTVVEGQTGLLALLAQQNKQQ